MYLIALSDSGPMQPLISRFHGDNSPTFNPPALVRTQNITFRRVVCLIDPVDGSPTLKETEETETGVLDVQPMTLSGQNRGKTKDIYPVRTHGSIFTHHH